MVLTMSFLFVVDVVQTKGMSVFISALLENIERTLEWGGRVTFLVWVLELVAGFIPRFQKTSSLILSLMLLVCLVVIVGLFGSFFRLLLVDGIAGLSCQMVTRAQMGR